MSRLDSALLKIYDQHDAEPAPSSPEPSQSIPLSEALEQRDTPSTPFRPMLQVDAFAWPETLLEPTPQTEDSLDEVAAALVRSCDSSPAVVALTGATAGAGCSTLLLGAARRLAACDVKVALVDADQLAPSLAPLLGLLPSLGWEEIAADRQPLEEVLIESIEDHIALLPLCRPESLTRLRDVSDKIAPAVETLRNHYDLVLVDLGSPTHWLTNPLDELLDAAILVHNASQATLDDLREAADRLAARRVSCPGIIENFTTSQTTTSQRRAA